MESRNEKKLIKYFIVVFLVVFMVANWANISWLFNLNFLSEAFSSFANKENNEASNSITRIELKEEEFKETDYYRYTDKENSLEIEKIDVFAPIVIGSGTDNSYILKDLRSGVVYYPSSALPGKEGRTIILGHSAPVGWPKINYDWIFNELNLLEKGDKIIVNFNNREYLYYVEDKYFLDKGQEVPDVLTNSNNMLTLISCWPPGKDLERIVVEAKSVKNN
ncbi:MAG: class E sortase [Candidatus Pacebacteria bacterium]|nr:class E sortase [Candidatus Paceibacterota bacterium]